MRKVVRKSKKNLALGSGMDSAKVSWGFSDRGDKNMSLCYGEVSHSLGHRMEFLNRLKIDYRSLVCAKQVHGSRLVYVREEDKGKGALDFESSLDACDGLITDVPGVPLGVFSADCAVVFLYDPQRPAIGLIHAGWRGTREHILEKALALMKEKFKTKTSSVRVAFGPAIRACCYEVGDEFLRYFPGHVVQADRRYCFDLVGANRKQLAALSVPQEHIFDTGICTACNHAKYFSHRKGEKDCGRMMSVIMLK